VTGGRGPFTLPAMPAGLMTGRGPLILPAMPAAGTAAVPVMVALRAGPGAGRPFIGRQAAQRLARTELSKPIYHQHLTLVQLILRYVTDFLSHLFGRATAVPGGWWGLVALAALAVIGVAGLLAWIGPVRRRHRGARPLAAPGQARTARDHRLAAARLAQAGDYAQAIAEGVRAIAAELEERGALPPRTGRTADEFAAEAGQLLPAQARALASAATLFDEVCYGRRPGSQAGYQRIRELDAAVMAAAPRVTPAAGPGRPVLAGSGRS
jgi:Domain of unknown function (DUF4129)